MKLVFLIVITLITLVSYSQKSNEFRTYYEFSGGGFVNNNLDGIGSYGFSNFREFGIRYLRKIKPNLYLETGLDYQKANLSFTKNVIPNPIVVSEEYEMVTIPIYINYSLGKYFFVNGGPMLDFQITKNPNDSQSGIGYNIGIGGKYNFKKYFIYATPNFKKHSFIPFKKEKNHQRLTKVGIQLGIGFNF